MNFTHIKGDTFEAVNFEILINGSPIDLTNCVLRMQLRKEYGGVIIKSFTTIGGDGLTITNGTLGLFKINKQIIDVTAFSYLYDMELDYQNGDVKTYIKGNFTITNDVTR